MPFSPFQDKNKNYKSDQFQKKTEFINMSEGNHRIRVLEPDYKEFPTHFFPYNKVTVLCLGDNCPICAHNRELSFQISDWKELSRNSQYSRVTLKYYINVLDKTPHKVCTKCSKEHFNYSGMFCQSCNEQLPEASPLNKVKILAKGISLFQDMQAIENAIQDSQGNPIGLQNYDLNIVVRGAGRDTAYTVIADTGSNTPVNMEELTLFPLESAVIRLSPEEMLDVQRGVSLKDIFTARNAKQVSFPPQDSVQISEQEKVEVSDKVNALFQN